MMAIFKRELLSYFKSFSGYIFLGAFYFIAGLYFRVVCLSLGEGNLNIVFSGLLFFTMLLTPILTMKILSEEFKMRTDQALFTAPIRTFSIVTGKYFSSLCIYFIGIGITLIYGGIITFFCTPNWIEILGSFLGLFLLGAALMSIGMYISSLTESQVTSAISCYIVTFVILFIDEIANWFNDDLIKNAIKYLSFTKHYTNFTMGILNISDLVFFLSICVTFIFLTVQSLEKRKYN